MTFDELNEKLNTSDKDDSKKFDWGSFGDDALYKFLSANCIKWNNGDNTRQIEVYGARQRYYILDDARCPLPGKSYKDLTPKELETVIKDWTGITRAIRNEEKNYHEAKIGVKKEITFLKDWIKDDKELMKGKTVDEVYDAIRKKEIVLITKYSTERLSTIIKYEAIIKQQIRSPQQILDDRINGTKTIGQQTEDEQFEDQMWGDII